jgi:hypothetical protein
MEERRSCFPFFWDKNFPPLQNSPPPPPQLIRVCCDDLLKVQRVQKQIVHRDRKWSVGHPRWWLHVQKERNKDRL